MRERERESQRRPDTQCHAEGDSKRKQSKQTSKLNNKETTPEIDSADKLHEIAAAHLQQKESQKPSHTYAQWRGVQLFQFGPKWHMSAVGQRGRYVVLFAVPLPIP